MKEERKRKEKKKMEKTLVMATEDLSVDFVLLTNICLFVSLLYSNNSLDDLLF